MLARERRLSRSFLCSAIQMFASGFGLCSDWAAVAVGTFERSELWNQYWMMARRPLEIGGRWVRRRSRCLPRNNHRQGTNWMKLAADRQQIISNPNATTEDRRWAA